MPPRSCPIERGGTSGGTNGGTKTVHLSLYPFSVPTAGSGSEFPRQIAPPLVGRAARLRPPSRAIDTHIFDCARDCGLVRHACPIRHHEWRTRLSAEVGRRVGYDKRPAVAPPTSGGALIVDLRTDRRSRERIIRRGQNLATSTSLPVRVTNAAKSTVRWLLAETTSRPLVFFFPFCIHRGRVRPN